ncbi:MAG TPA: DUF2127 domain-containing protein [Acidimicrobiales bacterium]|nr:DUF2127 domain-containing protein [Acidimicrobiales bacterium]
MVKRLRGSRDRKLSYELLDCAWHGHTLVGTDAAALRSQDELFARELGGLRWYRCLRCDSWLPSPPPSHATREFPPERSEITLPLRGEPLRSRYVLRLIAFERSLHFVVLWVLAIGVFVFAVNKSLLNKDFVRIVNALQGGIGGPIHSSSGGVEHELTRLFAISTRTLVITGLAVAAYATLEGVEAVGLWRGLRWAEYLAFISTSLFLPLEIYEIAHRPTVLKAITLVINLAIVLYLIIAKRLFGLRGGIRAERALLMVDAGWPALERATPRLVDTPRP